jgi:hypothetical protein
MTERPVAGMTARDLRFHLRDGHDLDLHGFAWLQLVATHNRKHRAGADHDHERTPMPEGEA